MKYRDLKNEGGTFENVGQIMDFLSQFPRTTTIRANAEVDACREEGFEFIGFGVKVANEQECETMADYADKDVTEVSISIDH